MSEVGFALGSNLGDRQVQLERAIALLEQDFSLTNMRVSSFIETPALLPAGAGEDWNLPFMNAVMVAQKQTPCDPMEMLRTIKRLEQQLGRQKRGHWAPREIDIDLLFVEGEIVNMPELTLPHPQMHLRHFVMEPLAEIAPDWVHPLIKRTARELSLALN